LVFAFALFGLLCFAVIPQYLAIFREMRLQLPAISEVVLSLGRDPLTFIILPVAGVVLVLVLVYIALRATPAGRRAWARFVYRIPIIGTLIRAARLSAFADLLGVLVDHGLPLPEAFRLTGEATSDPLTAHAAHAVEEDLLLGRTLGEALVRHRVVPELIAWMTGFGERRGTLGATLHQVAAIYRRQVEMRAALLRSLLPGLMIIGTAVIILGLFILALLLPLFRLLEGLGGFR
jgi:type IV pilus assembly protein PilC